MDKHTLGSDVYKEFTVKVRNRAALITHTEGELYRNGEFVCHFPSHHAGFRVTGIIVGNTFSTVGDYVAKFNVFLESMGKHEYAIPFKITESVLGKKRVITSEANP